MLRGFLETGLETVMLSEIRGFVCCCRKHLLHTCRTHLHPAAYNLRALGLRAPGSRLQENFTSGPLAVETYRLPGAGTDIVDLRRVPPGTQTLSTSLAFFKHTVKTTQGNRGNSYSSQDIGAFCRPHEWQPLWQGNSPGCAG